MYLDHFNYQPDQSPSTDFFEKSNKFLSDLVDSMELNAFLKEQKITLEEFRAAFKGRLEPYLSDQFKNRSASAALLCTIFNINTLPRTFLEELNLDKTSVDTSVTPFFERYHLCTSAEDKFMRSLNDGACLNVDNRLLLKMNGKVSAVALRNFIDKNGHVFLSGVWYSPNLETKLSLVGQFLSGSSFLPDISSTGWIYQRPFIPRLLSDGKINTYEDLMQTWQAAAKNCLESPVELPQGMLRSAYFDQNYEQQY